MITYAAFDALKKFKIPEIHSAEIKGCGCGDILRGIKAPQGCPLFKKTMYPNDPIGPCMVFFGRHLLHSLQILLTEVIKVKVSVVKNVLAANDRIAAGQQRTVR